MEAVKTNPGPQNRSQIISTPPATQDVKEWPKKNKQAPLHPIPDRPRLVSGENAVTVALLFQVPVARFLDHPRKIIWGRLCLYKIGDWRRE